MHYLPPQGTEARDATDVNALVLIGTKQVAPTIWTLAQARARAKRWFVAAREAGLPKAKAVFYTVLMGNDDLCLMKIGPRGGATVVWNYTRGGSKHDPEQSPFVPPRAH